jgi:hypothetical protein
VIRAASRRKNGSGTSNHMSLLPKKKKRATLSTLTLWACLNNEDSLTFSFRALWQEQTHHSSSGSSKYMRCTRGLTIICIRAYLLLVCVALLFHLPLIANTAEWR